MRDVALVILCLACVFIVWLGGVSLGIRHAESRGLECKEEVYPAVQYIFPDYIQVIGMCPACDGQFDIVTIEGVQFLIKMGQGE